VPPLAVLNVSTFEKVLVTVRLVAWLRQYHGRFGPRSRVNTQLVVPPLPSGTPPAVNVRAASSGNVLRSETSKRYVTVPALPVAVELFTTSVGRGEVTVCPPTGALAAGADNVTGVDVAARCVMLIVEPAIVSVAARSVVDAFAATANCTVPLPVPEAPWAMVMKLEPLVAVHEQVLAVVTDAVPVPPSGGNADTLGCPTVNEQVVDGVVGFDLEHAQTVSTAKSHPGRMMKRLDRSIVRDKIHRCHHRETKKLQRQRQQ